MSAQPQYQRSNLDPAAIAQLDQHDFAALTEPHRRELQVHCYRMLGSIHDAEDMVQETFLRAWLRRETFEGRASFRAWLYKIASNVCLDALDKRPRRVLPMSRRPPASTDDPIPPPLSEPIWLEPFPDELLAPEEASPEARISAQENITLAFIAALHLLPPRQRAVLILRDVLDWQANEVADLLNLSVPAVKSALHRARTTLTTHYPSGIESNIKHLADKTMQPQLERYVTAWQSADVNMLLSLLTEEATFSMPPIPVWYRGRADIGWLFTARLFTNRAQGRWRLLPSLPANHQITFGLYQRDENDQRYHVYGVQVLRFKADQIAEIITFRTPTLASYFKLPSILTD
ncbi:MAG: sigma-70 family RNA polymerase sigma factor [Anaerolineae bacterium]|nr:sigma-70 family RNA polymerase sigma factor [Anaerolineae bacterium]